MASAVHEKGTSVIEAVCTQFCAPQHQKKNSGEKGRKAVGFAPGPTSSLSQTGCQHRAGHWPFLMLLGTSTNHTHWDLPAHQDHWTHPLYLGDPQQKDSTMESHITWLPPARQAQLLNLLVNTGMLHPYRYPRSGWMGL